MILLFLFNLYLGFNLSEQTAGNGLLNDYNVEISAKLRDNRIEYSYGRENEIQSYFLQVNTVMAKDKYFVALSNIFDNENIKVYQENIGIGLLLKKDKITNYLTPVISMDKYKEYKTGIREEIIWKKIVSPNLQNDVLNALLKTFVYCYVYEIRANVVYCGDRWSYEFESNNDFNFTKAFGFSIGGRYGKYNNIEYHKGSTKLFLSF